jgi:hypothetical protein
VILGMDQQKRSLLFQMLLTLSSFVNSGEFVNYCSLWERTAHGAEREPFCTPHSRNRPVRAQALSAASALPWLAEARQREPRAQAVSAVSPRAFTN